MAIKLSGPERLSFRALCLSGFFASCEWTNIGKRMNLRSFFLLLITTSLLTTGCGVLATRPARHLGYAEAAYIAAQKANAETNFPQEFQLARETLFRARAAYRLKNFKRARKLAVRARLLSEEAEFKSTFKDVDPSLIPKTNPDEDD